MTIAFEPLTMLAAEFLPALRAPQVLRLVLNRKVGVVVPGRQLVLNIVVARPQVLPGLRPSAPAVLDDAEQPELENAAAPVDHVRGEVVPAVQDRFQQLE